MSKVTSSNIRVLDEIEHVIHRPGMYIGSTKPHTDDIFIFENGKFEKRTITYNPGFLKIFDEIISNSVDESKKNPNLNYIHVTINQKNGEISVWDNGGIEIKKHETGDWIPSVIFSNLRAGSNFDDTEDRTGAGTNGVGSTLTNIFSKKFTVKTADGISEFNQVFSDNLSKRTTAVIKPSEKQYTEISFIPDYPKFGMEIINEEHIHMLRKRVIDIAACNPNLKLQFNNEKYRFKSFKEYAELFTENVLFEKTENWEVAVAHSTIGNQNISFVNSVETKDGGTHVDYVTGQIIQKLRVLIKKKHKVEIKPSDIRNHMMVFINATIVRPAFSAQTKEKLITESKEFGSVFEISDRMIKQIFSSEIVSSILDWIEKKKLAEERAELRKLNKDLNTSKILKLIDAKARENREQCTLGIFEGDSAISAVREFRDPQIFGAFPLKGKSIPNISEMKASEIAKSDVVVNLMGSIGLRLGESPKNLRYGKVLIYTDADPDGDCICGLIINLFNRYWPELFDEERILKVLTPIVVAKKGKESISFYTKEEYSIWESKTNIKGWNIEYKKGLAALESSDYEQIIHNPKTVTIKNDPGHKETLNAWFGNDSSLRKEKLLKK